MQRSRCSQSNKHPRFRYAWQAGHALGGIVEANTRSEARAQIKSLLGLKRVRVGTPIQKIGGSF
jgi:hypothetical protein